MPVVEQQIDEYLTVLKSIDDDLKGNQIDQYYDTPEVRESYRSHMTVFKAGSEFRERAMLGGNRVGKTFVGSIQNHFKKAGVIELISEASELEVGDEYLIIGDTTGVVEGKIESMSCQSSN